MNFVKALKVQVSKKEAMTPDILLFRLESTTDEALPNFAAGAHINVAIAPEITRAYSLCNDPATAKDYYEIAVKREADGRGGSIAMHDNIKIGDEITISAPENFFPLAEQVSHHLLIAGGIGLTPIMSMAHQLDHLKQPFSILVCAAGEERLPFAKQLADTDWTISKNLSGRHCFDLASLLKDLPQDLHVYCCGPESLMNEVRTQCQHLPEGHLHEERFGSLESDDNGEIDLYLSQSQQHVIVPAGTSMITALRQAGVEVESVCEQGICGSCVVPWHDGDPIHRDQCLEPEEQQEYVALCCAGCRSPNLTLDL